MASAKQSALDTLHRLYVATLTLQLQAGEPSAAMLATIGSFLSKSGVKAAQPCNASPVRMRHCPSPPKTRPPPTRRPTDAPQLRRHPTHVRDAHPRGARVASLPRGDEGVEPLIKECIATNYTDEVLAHGFRQQAAQKRAKEAQDAALWLADRNAKLAAEKVTTAHNTALATERKQTMTYQERAERAEWKAKGLEAQVNGLLRGQRS
jgi:hypothetical protein